MIDKYTIDKDIIFHNRPTSIPFGYGLSYKLALVCISLNKNSPPRQSCRMVKLQLIITTLLSEGSLINLIKLKYDKSYMITPIRFDPSINKVIVFGIKDGIIKKFTNGNYALTELGKKFVNKIYQNRVFNSEVNELDKLGIIDNQTVDAIIRTWGYNDKN